MAGEAEDGVHSEFLVPIGICHLGSLSPPSWGPPSPPYLSPSIPSPLLRKAEIWVTVLAGPMQAGSLPRLPLFLKGHVSQGDKALKSRAHYMLRAWPDSERKLRGTPCPQHSQDKVLGSEREGGARARLQEISGGGPQPSSFSGPSQQTDVGYGSFPESHMQPLQGLNFVQGHMGVLTAPGRARWAGKAEGFVHQRVRAHDSTALTRGSKTQDLCMSHTCGMSALCRKHSICVPTS